MTARIISINLSWKDNYVSFDDTDLQTDYFHGYSLGINRTVERVKDKGGRKISVSVTNDDAKIPALKRVEQIAKECGYTIEDKSHMHTYQGYNNQETQSYRYEWLLSANEERLKQLDAQDLEEKRKITESEAYAKTPEARRARLKAEIHQVQNVTAVFDERGFHTVTDEERQAQLRKLEADLAEIV